MATTTEEKSLEFRILSPTATYRWRKAGNLPSEFAGGEPLDVPEAMELLSRMKRQKGQRT
jgi:hypothetical protein